MAEIRGFKILEERLPAGFGDLVLEWLDKQPIQIRLSRPRLTKLGDFRPANKKRPARISVNFDLHPVEFLLTLAHELAHADNWQLNGRRVKPHGIEWKAAYRDKLVQILDAGLLDEKFEKAIRTCYFKSEKLATSSCTSLRRIFDADANADAMDSGGSGAIRVEDIPLGSTFKTSNGKTFIKGEKLRSRYKCRELISSRIYTVHPMAEIVEFKPPKL